MKATVQVTYEVDLNEINRLPVGFMVMQEDTQTKRRAILSAHIDFFSPNMQRFKYFIFSEPPLPKLAGEFNRAGARQ